MGGNQVEFSQPNQFTVNSPFRLLATGLLVSCCPPSLHDLGRHNGWLSSRGYIGIGVFSESGADN
jgi:hypothetical protein